MIEASERRRQAKELAKQHEMSQLEISKEENTFFSNSYWDQRLRPVFNYIVMFKVYNAPVRNFDSQALQNFEQKQASTNISFVAEKALHRLRAIFLHLRHMQLEYHNDANPIDQIEMAVKSFEPKTQKLKRTQSQSIIIQTSH